ncbi:hypothetical protein MRX96_011715 [Rhipicephalus microplus]
MMRIEWELAVTQRASGRRAALIQATHSEAKARPTNHDASGKRIHYAEKLTAAASQRPGSLKQEKLSGKVARHFVGVLSHQRGRVRRDDTS